MPTVYGRRLVVATIKNGNESFAIGSVHLESLDNHPTREDQMAVCNEVLTKHNHSLLCGDFNFCSHSNYNGGRGPLENESLGRIMPEFDDVWLKLKSGKLGFIFDTEANPMIGNKVERMRYDRIVYRSVPQSSGTNDSTNKRWNATKIEIVGDLPIKNSSEVPTIAEKTIWNKLFGGSSSSSSSTTAAPTVAPASGYSTPPREQTVMVNTRDRVDMVPLFPSDHFGLYAEFELV